MNKRLFCCSLGVLVLALGAVCSGETIQKTARVDWDPVFGGGYRGVWPLSNGVELISYYRIGKDTPLIVIEAEQASAVLYHEGGGKKKDATLSGGAYVSLPKKIELFLRIEEPESYSIWYRVRFLDGVGETKHLEGLEPSLGGPVGWVPVKKEADGWHWLKGRLGHRFKRKGMRELQLDGISVGLEMDKIVLAADPQWHPDKNGADQLEADKPFPWTDAGVDSGDLFFAQVDRWGTVTCDIDEKGGRATFLYSLDSGKTWENMPADGDLSAVPARGDGRDTIRFKIQMRRKAGESSPVVSAALGLTYFASSDSVFSVRDSLSRYSFARKTGALCGIEYLKNGRVLTPLDVPSPIFVVYLKKPGFQPDEQVIEISSLAAECLESGVEERAPKGYHRKLRFRYRVSRSEGTVDVVVRVAFREPGESLWSCKVTNNLKTLSVCKVIYPVLSGVKAGDNHTDDKLLLRGSYVVSNPSMWGHFLYWWPGVCYPMLDISCRTNGISLIARDKTLRTTGVSAKGQKRNGAMLRMHKILDLKPAEACQGAPNLVRVHDGDWQTACLLEKEWANQAFPAAKSPLWAEELDVFASIGWPVPVWSEWEKMAADIRGATHAPLLGMWNFQIPGTHWAMPHPNPIMGDEEDLRQAVRDVHKSGMRFIMYIQSLLTDKFSEGSDPEDRIGYLSRQNLWPGWELPPAGFADRNRVYNRAGAKVPYNARSTDQETMMNQAASGTRAYKIRWAVEQHGRKLGLDGIYWDSDSRGGPSWGNSDLYGDDPGMNGVGVWKTQEIIRQAFTKRDPACVFVGEGPPSAVMGMVRDFTLDNVASLWPQRVLFPRMKILLGGANRADPGRRRAFLAGARYDGIDSKDELQTAFLWMRRRVKQYLYSADFLNEMGMQVHADGVKAKLLQLERTRNRGVILNILNEARDEDGYLQLEPGTHGQFTHGWLVDSDRRDGPFTEFSEDAEGSCKIRIPDAAASHVILFSELEPRVTVSSDQELVAGGEIVIAVEVESLDGQRRTGKIIPEPPKGLNAEAVTFSVGGRGASRKQQLTVLVKAAFDTPAKIVDIPLTIKPDGGPPFQKVISAYVHEPVDATFSWVGPEKLAVQLRNRTSHSCSGVVEFQIVKGKVELAGGLVSQEYELAGGGSKDYAFDLVGAEEAEKPWALKGKLSCRMAQPWFFGLSRTTKRESLCYKKIWPIVPNGSVEFYDFRRGAPEKEHYAYSKNKDKMEAFPRNVPDYWWGMMSDRSPRLSHRSGVSIDETIASDGKRSIKLVPGTNFSSFVLVPLVKGRKYRLRLSIRSSAPSARDQAIVGRYVSGNKFSAAANVRLAPKDKPNTWRQLEKTFTATTDGSRLYMYSGKQATVWFDNIQIVPVQ